MTEKHNDLSPNGFPLAPDWAWSIRAAVYPGKKIDEGNTDLLNLDIKQINDKQVIELDISLIRKIGFVRIYG